MQNDFDRELQNYFTDVEHLRGMFKQWLAAPALPKRMLVIHGVGGVGKSSLLRMFRLHCKSVGVPVALASGDEQKSALEVLTRWADDLKADGVRLPEFDKTFQQYRAIQAKVENEATKVAGKLAKTAAATVVETVASTIPGIGPLLGKLGGMGAEALVDWLRGFLTKPDIDLLLDPAKKLTADFLADLQKVANRRRIVLMLDTFEQMTALEDWAREVAQQLPANVLLVIAGRALPNWDRAWPGWMANAQVEELKPMSEDDMRELVRRYYATLRGGEPDPKQVEAIIRFARGLPMVVTSAVQLWVRYPDTVGDFQAIKPYVVADLVDRLMEGVPKAIVPALEAAAIVRWFDQPILRAVMAQEDVSEVYNELRRFPFVRTRAEGLALHDAVREIMDENLRVQDAERHRELHERAAAYFEKQAGKAKRETEKESFILERLYHLIRGGNESQAIEESQVTLEMALGYYHRFFAESIISLLEKELKGESSRDWLAYLRWLVTKMNPQVNEQVIIGQSLAKVLERPGIEPRLWALVAVAIGDLPGESNIASEKQVTWLEKAITSDFLLPREAALGYLHLGGVYGAKAEWEKAIGAFTRALLLYEKSGITFGQIRAIDSLAYTYLLMGEWRSAVEWAEKGISLSRQTGGYWLTTTLKTLGWAHTYRGDLKTAMALIQEALELARQRQDEAEIIRVTRRLAEIYDRQGLWSLSNQLYQRLIQDDKKFGRIISMSTFMALLGISYLKQGLLGDAERLLHESLVHIHLHVRQIALCGLGDLYLTKGDLDKAYHYYAIAQSITKGRPYYLAQAKLGLLRVDVASRSFNNEIQQIEQICISRDYNDHLASLRLTQGHIAWEGNAPAWENGFDAALRYYQHALIYALRYNRFLLDEVLSGRPQGTPLRPIIPECLKRGEEGRRMLIALRDWWQTGVNDIGTPRPDTISPIREGIPLLEAERIAREREPGDGTPQKSVVEQIEAALKNVEAG
jgi:tetratricopeptide (TPR) repeat protein